MTATNPHRLLAVGVGVITVEWVGWSGQSVRNPNV